MKFVIFHGAFGSPEANWFPELKDKLESLGQEVIAPRFPVDDWQEITRAGQEVKPKKQSLNKWLEAFEKVRQTFTKGDKLCFVGHSLGPLFILHVVEKYNIQLDSAIFVSPFMDKLNRSWQIDHVNETFYKTDFDFEKLKKLIPVSYVLYSNDDPYVDKNHAILFGKALDSSMILVKRAGHMNSEVNLNEFPLIFDLCAARLDLSLYQRYLTYKSNLQAIKYIKEKEGKIRLNPEEVGEEGMFHFRNLSKEGFCTFYTAGVDFWDPNSLYMQEARRAAHRVKNFTRVFIVGKPTELKNSRLKKQMSLDIAAGIAVFLCNWRDIKDEVKEQDFGIWDNDYVCTVRYGNKPGRVDEIELSSKAADINQANNWKRIILAKAHRVKSVEELVSLEKSM